MMKRILRSPITTAALFILAAGLLLTGTIGSVRAAPLITNDNDYTAQMELSSIGVSITNSGTVVGDDLLKGILPADEAFQVGRSYPAALAVANTGSIGEYVRVTVYKYWTDSDGKRVDLDPGLIDIHWVTDGGWTIDEGASTAERTVLYWANVVPAEGSAGVFADSIMVSGDVYRAVSQAVTDGPYDYDYENLTFHIEAVADGVQEHNIELAMPAAWGRQAG